MAEIKITNEDNMVLMARYPDKYFDLAIVDPPYGLPKDSLNGRGKMKNRAFLMDTTWDVAPNPEYFKELFRVSKNQIIWGGNYFKLDTCRCFIIWDKCQPWENFSQVEMAWTSFNKPAPLFKFDNRTGGKIHPTQKPVRLYQWVLDKFAEPGDKILDTHLGSGSIAIACHDYGFDLTACELDKDYYEAGLKRLNEHMSQLKIEM